jgi:hypothetical protein
MTTTRQMPAQPEGDPDQIAELRRLQDDTEREFEKRLAIGSPAENPDELNDEPGSFTIEEKSS